MSRRSLGIWMLVLAALAAVACGSANGSGEDADTDTDGDSDSEIDTCSISDAFDEADCPEIDPFDTKLRHVDINTADLGDGVSWSTAFDSVQPAIDACRCVALVLSEPCQVWVAAGDYGVVESIRLRPGVELYGGFAGGETVLEERDVEVHETILNGGGLAKHVVVGADDARLDGFTITGGYAPAPDELIVEYPYEWHGAGMLNLCASPAVANCRFTDNYAYYGGGMYNISASPIVLDSEFSQNTNDGMVNRNSSPIVTRCLFEGNGDSEWIGVGGMVNVNSSPSVSDCRFEMNLGGGMESWHGAPEVTRTVFFANTGVGLEISGAECQARVTECLISGNTGGGVLNLNAPTIIDSCTIAGNTAQYGAGLRINYYYVEEGEVLNTWPTIRNTIIWGNTATEGGDDLWSPEAASDPPLEMTFQKSLIGGCGGSTDWDTTCGTDLGGNIDADPLFADAEGGVLSLTSGSPCIDTGDNALLPNDVADLDDDGDTDEPLPLDLAGNPRVTDGDGDSTATVDMGAYEVQP